MIQANEMRLSNIVQPNYEHANQFHGYGRVTAIYHSEEKGERFTVDYHYPGSWFEPVKLSPSILEACGFDNIHPASWYLSWESYELQYSTDDKELGILSPDGCTSGHTVYFPCGQLHLLQNIYFFFTGTELSINLEKAKA